MPRKVDREGTIKRREQILKAAGKCFAAKGFHQSSMADICKEAGLSPGTVYHYFRSKDEMVLHFAQRELEQAQEYAEVLEHIDSVEELVEFTISAILEPEEHGELQFYLELLTEGGRNRDVGKALLQADEVVYYALKKHLKRLEAHGHGASKSSLAYYVGMQIVDPGLLKLMRSGEKRREIGLCARKTAEQYSWSRVGASHEAFYKKILSKRESK